MSTNRYNFERMSGVIGKVWLAAPESSLLIAFNVDSNCQGKGAFSALWRNLIEEKMFLIEPKDIVIASSLAKAKRVSLSVGHIWVCCI